jgi:hypothetical protein
VKLAHAIGRVLERVKSRAGSQATFGRGIAVPFVGRLPASGSRAPTSVSHGGRDRIVRIVADIQGVQDVSENVLGQAGESIGVFEFLRSDARSCELGLDETEPNMRFLLIIRTKFHLGSYCRSYGLNQIIQGHVQKIGKNWRNPKICRGLVPRRAKYGSHCGTRCTQKNENS